MSFSHRMLQYLQEVEDVYPASEELSGTIRLASVMVGLLDMLRRQRCEQRVFARARRQEGASIDFASFAGKHQFDRTAICESHCGSAAIQLSCPSELQCNEQSTRGKPGLPNFCSQRSDDAELPGEAEQLCKSAAHEHSRSHFLQLVALFSTERHYQAHSPVALAEPHPHVQQGGDPPSFPAAGLSHDAHPLHEVIPSKRWDPAPDSAPDCTAANGEYPAQAVALHAPAANGAVRRCGRGMMLMSSITAEDADDRAFPQRTVRRHAQPPPTVAADALKGWRDGQGDQCCMSSSVN